jgi:hypothetical protein
MQGELIKKWGHNELQEDLAAYIRANSDRLAWTNMPMGSAGNCRPDVYAIPKSFANFKPLIYEIKVSVSDFRSDVTSGKWQNYMKFACGVIFAVPEGLITKNDIPATCGLIVRHESGWRSAKKPTLQYLDTLPKELWIKLLIDGISRHHDLNRHLTQFNEYVARDKLAKKYGEKVGKLLRDLSNTEANVQQEIRRLDMVSEEIKSKRERALQLAREEDASINQTKSDFCTSLGLPTDSNHYMIERRCLELVKRLSENEEIQRLTNILSRVENSIEEGKKPLPQFKAVA